MELLSLIIAFALGFVMRVFGFPPMLGYLIAGFVLNMMGLEDSNALESIANLGILLLLFTIGLKLNIRSLFRKHVLQGGVGHMLVSVCTFSVLLLILRYAGMNIFSELTGSAILLISFALSFSSTVFAVKVLEENGEMQSLMGKTSIAILIIQDILAVIFITASKGQFPSIYALGLLGFPFLRKPLMWLMNRSGHGEMMVLFGFILALITANLFELVGLKPDLGALAAGLVVANSKKSEELAKTLLNFKEFFLVAFFLRIGLIDDLQWWMFGIAMAFIIFLPFKSFLYFWILTKLNLRARTSFWISLTLSNYSEFALIVGSVAASSGMLPDKWLIIFALTVTLSFLISSPLNSKLYFAMFERYLMRFETKKRLADDRPIKTNGAEILIFGMGKLGTMTYEYMASRYHKRVLGLDADYGTVIAHRRQHRNVIIGDATDSGFWENLEPGNVDIVLLAMNNFSANRNAAIRLQNSHFNGKIAAVARYDDEKEELHKLGVHSVFNLYEEAGIGFAEHVCDVMGQKEKLVPKEIL